MGDVTAIGRALGGEEVLERVPRDELDLAGLVRAGLSLEVVDRLLARGDVSRAELARLVLPPRTLSHRRARGEPLSSAESDRLLRLVRLLVEAETTFGDADKAATWLRRPNRALTGQAPLDLLDSDAGARSVETLLGRIAHGIAE